MTSGGLSLSQGVFTNFLFMSLFVSESGGKEENHDWNLLGLNRRPFEATQPVQILHVDRRD